MEALLTTVGKRESCAKALASSQGRDAFLCQAAAACDALDDDGGGGGSGRPSEARRKQGQALLKLAQGCLQQLSSTTSTSSNAEGGGSACRVEGEAQLALYQAASKAAHAVASRAAEVLPPPSTSSSSSSPSSMAGGLERILYHVIARGMEVKQYRDVQDLTRALAARVSALLEARPPPPAAARRAGDDEDDWGAEAAAAAASSGRQKKVAAASDGASSGKGRRPPRGGGGEGGEGSGSGGFGFPAPPAGCFDATLAKLVCSAAVNGARAIAEEAAVASPGDAKDWATRLEAAAVECLPWVQTLRASSNSSDATAAKEAGERLFRALWKGATALDQREEWDGALRLRRVACTLKCVGVAQVVGQLWRAGAAYEKAAASLSSYSSRALLEGVVALYEAAGEEAVFVDARAEQQQQLLLLHWAVACVEALDWLRHHGSLCARLQQPARASALVQRALASCEMGKGAKKEKTEEDPRLSLARVALRLQLATASLAAGLGGTGGSSGSDRNTGSSGRKGKAGYQEEEQGRAVLEEALTALDAVQHSVPGGQQQPKSLLEQPQPHVVRVWRALARLPTVLPSSALTTTSTSDTAGASCCSPATVEAAARGFLALAGLSQALLRSPSPSASDGLSLASLSSTLTEAHLRLAAILTASLASEPTAAATSAAGPPVWAVAPPAWIAAALADGNEKEGEQPLAAGGDDAAALATTCLQRAEAALARLSTSTSTKSKSSSSGSSNLASARRRVAAAWYALGRALLPSASQPLSSSSNPSLRALGPLARGCRLSLLPSAASDDDKDETTAELLQQTQVDLRLATLAVALAGVGASRLARGTAARALGLVVTAAPTRGAGLVRRLLPCSGLGGDGNAREGALLDGAKLGVALAEVGAPAWALPAIEAVAAAAAPSSAASVARAGPLCMLLPASAAAGRALVARAELGASLALVYSCLRSALAHADAGAAQPPLAEARAALLAHRRCCREAANGNGLSPLAAVVEGARMARVLARARAAARAQETAVLLQEWLRGDEEEEEGDKEPLAVWAARVAAAIADATGRSKETSGLGQQQGLLYELAVAECMHGILLTEAAAASPKADAAAAAAPLARGLAAWRALCSSSAAAAVAVDAQLARQCFEALLDHHLSGDGPGAVRQAQVLETAAEVSRRFLFHSSLSSSSPQHEAFVAWVLSTLFARVEVPDVAEAYAARAAALTGDEEEEREEREETMIDLSSPSGLVGAARALATGATTGLPPAAAVGRLLLWEEGEGDEAGPSSLLRSLGHLVAADAALLEGDLPRAMRVLRRLSALCQGLPSPPSLLVAPTSSIVAAGREEGEEGEGKGGDAAVAAVAARVEVMTIEDDDDTHTLDEPSAPAGSPNASRSRPSTCPPPRPSTTQEQRAATVCLLPSLLVPPLLRPSWCLAECLVRLAELWEALGVPTKAGAYFRKALLLAQRTGRPGAARRAARGRARVKGEETEEVVVDGGKSGSGLDEALDEAEALLRQGDAARVRGAFDAAAAAYEGSERRRTESATAHPLGLIAHAPPSSNAARWRALAAALRWRRGWTGGWLVPRDAAKARGGGSEDGVAAAAAVTTAKKRKDKEGPVAAAAAPAPAAADAVVGDLVAVAEQLTGVPAVERTEALLRLAALKSTSSDGAEARQLLEQAWATAQRTRCPRLLRGAGRALAAAMAAEGQGTQRAASLVGRTVGVGFENWAPLLSSSGAFAAQPVDDDNDEWRALLPEGWAVVTLALAPTAGPDEGVVGTGEGCALLMGRIEKEGAVVGRVAACAVDEKRKGLVHVLAELEAVMERNVRTLKAPTAEELASWGKKEKAAWWREREVLDARLGELLGELEVSLGPCHWLLQGGIVLGGGEEGAEAATVVVDAALSTLGLSSGCLGEEEAQQLPAGLLLMRAALTGMVGKSDRAALAEALAAAAEMGVGKKGWTPPAPERLDAVLTLLGGGEEEKGEEEENTAAVASPLVGKRRHSSKGPSKRMSTLNPKRAVAAPAPAPAAAAAAAAAMVDVDALARNLSKLTVADLKKELSARALPAAGAKAVLLSRLEASLKVSSSSEGEDDTEAARRDTAPPPPLDAVFSSRTASRSSSTASASSSLSRGRAGTTVRSSVESVRSSSSSSSSASSAAAAPGAATSGPARHPVVLILDETLQRLPWESLPSLRGRPVSRCPSLAYVRAALLGRRRAGDNGSGKGKGKDKKPRSAAATTKGRRTTGAASASIAAAVEMKDDEPGVACVPSAPGYYLLDPEANLPDTRATLQPALARLAAAHGTKATEWSGVVGQAPEEASLKAHLGAASVFVYCGHGSGELFLPREDVAAMPQAPFAILMGCSSGRLKAPTPAFEPGGMVLSYLAAGAPAVVGNLWDVTDKDIDRFSLALLERLFHHNEEEEDSGEGSGGGLVLEAVAAARAACKLPFLVGAAPVVYGLPLRVVNGKRARR